MRKNGVFKIFIIEKTLKVIVISHKLYNFQNVGFVALNHLTLQLKFVI